MNFTLMVVDRLSFRMVTQAWGYFLWVNEFLYISSDGSESSPRIKFKYQSGDWLNLKSVVDGVNVKLYINDIFIKSLKLTGDGADSPTDNYVGLWCHRLVFMAGRDFKVTRCKDVFL